MRGGKEGGKKIVLLGKKEGEPIPRRKKERRYQSKEKISAYLLPFYHLR